MSKRITSNRYFSARWVSGITLLAVIVLAALLIAGTPASLRPAPASSSRNISAPTTSAAAITPATRARVNATYAALPLAFEANQGQVDPQVKYLARGNGYKLYLTSSHAVMTVSRGTGDSEVADVIQNKRRGPAKIRKLMRERARKAAHPSSLAVLQMNFLGANPGTQLTAEDQQAGRVNYFIGNDPAKWHSNIPLFGRVNYRDVYPGVDLAFHGAGSQLEFDYLVSPGADPEAIALGFQGAEKIDTTATGDLILTTPAGPVQLHKPVAYQEKDGMRQLVDVRFSPKHDNRVAFVLGPYDRSRQLVIDPTVTYSTYFGGNFADYGFGITTDASGNAFIAGATDSDSIPGPVGPTTNASFDVFVTEIGPTGALVFTTLFGGSADDFAGGIAVDALGVYVTGTTSSSDFPVTLGVVQPAFLGGAPHGNNDAFAVKLALNGSAIVWGTFIAGGDSDSGLGIAVDSTHNVYVVGETFSADLGGALGGVNPLPNGSAINLGKGGTSDDGYIVKLNATATAYSLVSYIGGSSNDLATGVALDGSGNIYVSGETISTDLPLTAPIQNKCGTDGTCNTSGSGPQDDAFVVAIHSTLSTYIYETYYGGSNADDAFAIAADGPGNAFVTGTTLSSDFPTAGPPFQSKLAGTQNAFVLELNPTGSAANYSTYLGGTGADLGLAIAVDGNDNAYVTGQTSSTDFPLLNSIQAFGGSTDAFVSVVTPLPNITPTPNSLIFSTYLGGGGDEDTLSGSITVDPLRNILVTGDTNSGNGSTSSFPLRNAIDGTYGGGTCTTTTGNIPCPDAFIAAYTNATSPDFALSASALSPASVADGASATSTVTVTALNGYSGTVNLACNVTGGGSPAPTCTLNPTSISGATTSTLTVHAIGASGALFRPTSIFYASWLPIVGLSLIGMRFGSAHPRQKRLLGVLLLGILMAALFFLPACGGSSHSTPPPPPCSGCTPAGNYTINVTGTDSVNANLTHSLDSPLTLTVQ